MRSSAPRSGSSPDITRSRRSRRGSAVIEFALVAPVLLAVLLGVIDYGWYFYREMQVVSAVREGARYGAATPRTNSPDPVAVATARVRTTLNAYGLSGGTATVTSVLTGVKPDTLLTVTGTLPYVPIAGFVPVPPTMRATMAMRLEDNL